MSPTQGDRPAHPDVLPADEPVAEQDPAHRAVTVDAILAAAAAGTAVLLATHDDQVARRYDRRLHVVDGTLVDQTDRA